MTLRALSDVQDALGSSLDLREVMRVTQPLLSTFLGAEHVALGTTAGGEPGEFRWINETLPAAFFAEYPTMIGQDFVLHAVTRAPCRVLRDCDMAPRSDVEANPFYQRARELHVPLEHVMAVMLEVGRKGSSGIALYRAGKRPFSEQDRAILQGLTPALVNAVRNCRRFEESERRGHLYEHVVVQQSGGVIFCDRAGQEIERTRSAAELVGKWFSHSAASEGTLPAPLASRVRRWLADAGDIAPACYQRPGASEELVVRPSWCSKAGQACLVLLLDERPKAPWSAAAWDSLTRREREIAALVAEGWDNALIAEHVGCSEPTVKTHLTRVFNKLGVSTRAQLIACVRRGGPDLFKRP